MSIAFLYPFGNLDNPKTGGQVYDGRFKQFLIEENIEVDVLDESAIGLKTSSTVLLLPIKLISNIRKLGKYKCIIFNTAFFPYYIIPFFILKLIYPRIYLFGIHHHFRFQEQNGIKRKIYKLLEFVNLRQCTSVINPCPYTMDILLKNSPNINVTLIENSFDITPKQISCFCEKNLLYVGSVYERKGIIYLIKAIAKLSDEDKQGLKVNIVGKTEKGPYLNQIIELIDRFSLNDIVFLRGRVSDIELERYYRTAYSFILPSLLEGYGLVIIEAMKYGLPVIAFNNSAMPYSIKDGYNGLLCENKNIFALSGGIHKILNDKVLHNKLVDGALQTFANIRSFEDMRNDVKNFLDSFGLRG